MPRDLFGHVTRPFAGVGARSRLTVPLSLAAHTMAVAAVVVVPLLATDMLPSLRGRMEVSIVTPLVPPEVPVRRLPPSEAPPASVGGAVVVDAPDGIPREPEVEPTDPVGHDVGTIFGDVESLESLTPPPPPPPPERPRAPVRVGEVTAPSKVHDVAPAYPLIAQSARVQGVVIIEATIGVDGLVVDARVLRSVPLLDQAALEAVRQWRYTPTRLNGVPVAVVMTVTVRFQLG